MLKIIKSYSNENCIACALRAALYLGRIFGSLICISCPHSDKTSSGSKFKISQVYLHMNAFIIFLILTMLLVFIINTFQMDYRGRLFIKNLIEILIYSGAVIVLGSSSIKSDIRVKELNGLSYIIEQKYQYGIKVLLHTDDVSKILYLYCVWFLLFMIGQIINITSYINIELNWSTLFIATVREFCYYSQMIFTLNAIILCHVYMALFNRCFLKIKDILGKNFTEDFSYSVTQYVKDLKSFQIDDDEVLQSIQKMRKLYANLFLNFRLSSQLISPQFVYWWLIGILLLTANLYFFITAITEETSVSYYEFIYHLKATGALFGLSWYLRIYQRVTDVGEDVMSFLFRYPISKLNQAEAAQVEMMITTLHIQKPVLKASDIFTVGTNLLASISGTVVTYVLVALQFHASWSK